MLSAGIILIYELDNEFHVTVKKIGSQFVALIHNLKSLDFSSPMIFGSISMCVCVLFLFL